MVATILGYGTSYYEVDAVISCSVQTNSYKISPYVSEGILTSSGGSVELDFTASADCWISFYRHQNGNVASGKTILTIYGTDGTALFRVYSSATNTVSLQYWDGSTWQDSDATFTITTTSATKWDIHIVLDNSTGVLDTYYDGTLQQSYSGDTIFTSNTQIDKILLQNSNQDSYSGIFVADASTVAMEYLQPKLNANGSHTDWNGDYSYLDENGEDRTDNIQAPSVNDISSFGFAALDSSFNTGYNISAVGVSISASTMSAASGSIQTMTRSGITDGFSTSHSITLSREVFQDLFVNNPDTASPWTFSEADAAEVGVKAIS